MSVEYAPKGLIGLLTPQANTTVEPEMAIMTPPGYAFINARLMSDKPSIEARLVDYFATLPGQLRQSAEVDVAAFVAFEGERPARAVLEPEHEFVRGFFRRLAQHYVVEHQYPFRDALALLSTSSCRARAAATRADRELCRGALRETLRARRRQRPQDDPSLRPITGRRR